MASRINLRLASSRELEDLRLQRENIGVLEVSCNETDISLNIHVDDGYIMEIDRETIDSNPDDIVRYFWCKNKKLTSVGLNEPVIDKVYYVKSDDDTNNIRVCIEETTSAINSCIRHKFAVSVEKRTTLPFYTNSFTQRTIEDITQGLQRPVLRRSVRIYHESDNKNANDYAYLGYES